MIMNVKKHRAINYQEYRFGRSQQRFRGPKPDLSKPYIAVIGGSEVYGRFVPNTFTHQLSHRLKMPVVNWGTPGAGPTFFLKDPTVLEACSNAKICVVSAMGAVPTSNRLYSVYKRRNSRVRSVSENLSDLYPGVDHTDYRFAHNMLRAFHKECGQRFRIVEREIQAAWIARMRELLDDIDSVKVLLWMSGRSPDDDAGPSADENFVKFPSFVTREMFETVAEFADAVVEYVASYTIAEDKEDGRIFDDPIKRPAINWPGPTMHSQTADVLEAPLRSILSVNM